MIAWPASQTIDNSSDRCSAKVDFLLMQHLRAESILTRRDLPAGKSSTECKVEAGRAPCPSGGHPEQHSSNNTEQAFQLRSMIKHTALLVAVVLLSSSITATARRTLSPPKPEATATSTAEALQAFSQWSKRHRSLSESPVSSDTAAILDQHRTPGTASAFHPGDSLFSDCLLTQ